jgi:hypothetical protein
MEALMRAIAFGQNGAMFRLFVTASLVLLLIGCARTGDPDGAPRPSPATPEEPEKKEPPAPQRLEFDEVAYRFQDASVPPPDHRSVTITAKDGTIVRVVDSYGDEIERHEGKLDPGAMKKLVDLLEEGKVRPRGTQPPTAQAECTGGTSEAVTLRNGGKEVFSGSIDHCGGSHEPDFDGDLGPFIAALKGMAQPGPMGSHD